MMSKYKINQQDVLDLYSQGLSKSETARRYCKKYNIFYDDKIRRKISHIIKNLGLNNNSDTQTSNYKQKVSKIEEKESKKEIFDALDDKGCLMDIETYCEYYGLDYSKVKSYKLVSHSGRPFYNVVFREDDEEVFITDEEFLQNVESFFNKLPKIKNKVNIKNGKIGVVKIADLHIGAVVEGLIRTPDYNPRVVVERLQKCVDIVNSHKYDTVHVHILGDIIEAFVLMHDNQWKNLDNRIVGAEAIKIATELLHTYFLSKIENLGEVKIVGGNHDRTSKDREDDKNAQAADLIAWGLELVGYDVEFNPFVITHNVEGICHILTHGHHGLSNRPTQQIIWDFGNKKYFNLVCEGHLHSNIERLSVKQIDKFQVVKDDQVDYRRMNVPSLFQGNQFSEYLGLTSTAGFLVVEDNGEGKPNVFNYCL